MKNLKLSVLAFLSLVIIFGLSCLPKRICFFGADSYSFYLGKSSSSFQEVSSSFDAALFRLTLGKVYGESAKFQSLDLESFIQSFNGEIVFVENLTDSTNYYCTADLPYSTTLYGEEINLHISISETAVKVGTPIIYGSY